MSPLNLLLKLGKRPAWSPYDIPRSVLRAWWNADDHGIAAFMTDDGAGLISSWTDRIGGLTLTGATTARPTWASGSFTNQDGGSNKAAVSFDGIANCLRGTTLTGLPASSTPGTIRAVADPGASFATDRLLFMYGNSSNGQNRQLRRRGTASGDFARASDGGATLSATSAVTWVASGQLSGSFDSTVSGWLNGTVFGPSSSGTLATTATRIAMGSDISTSAGTFSTVILRHAFVTTALTTLQRQQMEGWAAWDSGVVAKLPSDHPYKNAPP
jgi:hypothetical protein